jgi:hypothetical protein
MTILIHSRTAPPARHGSRAAKSFLTQRMAASNLQGRREPLYLYFELPDDYLGLEGNSSRHAADSILCLRAIVPRKAIILAHKYIIFEGKRDLRVFHVKCVKVIVYRL